LTGKVLDLFNIITPELLATKITEQWITWETLRRVKKTDWEEVRRYVYATDTTKTTNFQLPWKNKTTIPKLCQIRDNLYSNYTATLFPQRKWLEWEADDEDSQEKREAIIDYVTWCIEQPYFKHELDKIILDYIDYGNCFVTVEWLDERVEGPNKTQTGYVGPVPRRISPLDLVMNPTAENFNHSPKIVRSIVSMGELKELLERMSNDENRDEYEELWRYLREVRAKITSFTGDLQQQDNMYSVDGFTSFRDYINSDFCEVLTFYGDIYDPDNDEFLKNRVITVVDRHRIIGNKPNPSWYGYPPIFYAPWRKRQDNLWGMGPLDNLVGMQYRMDHVENMKADIFDLVTYPVQKVKGFVEDFIWQPGEKIFMGEEGDVELHVPDVNALSANLELQNLEKLMEEMAGAPREAMGFRTPGEKTKYEVQRMENASSRVFQNKIKQFEEQVVEPLLNAMLELARRNMTSPATVKVFDDEFKLASFMSLTPDDITGMGRIKPVGARHFAEQAELVQNLTNLAGSPLWQTMAQHFSGIQLAKTFEHIFNMGRYNLVMPYIGIAEQADAQRQAQALQEMVAMEAGTASGQNGDYDLPPDQQGMPGQPGQPGQPPPQGGQVPAIPFTGQPPVGVPPQ